MNESEFVPPDESAAEVEKTPPKKFTAMSVAELMAADLEIEFLVEGILAGGQAAVLAGPQKSLKTSLLIDLGLSLSQAGYFLGRFKVPTPKRVGIMTGEIGFAAVRNTIVRVCKAAGIDPHQVTDLVVTDQVPMIGFIPDQKALKRFCEEYGIEFLGVDPLYACLDGENQSNLSAQGKQLREFSQMCQEQGATLMFAHHTKRETCRIFEPLDLGHLHGAGLPEFVRQWILLSRRCPYVAGSGFHELHMVVGGSVGHEGLWGLNVTEGHRDDPGGRRWEVDVFNHEELREADSERKEARQNKGQAKRLEADRKEIVTIMTKLGGQVTQREIRDRSNCGAKPFGVAWHSLVDDGTITSLGRIIKRGNGQTYEGFALNQDEA